MKHEVTGMASLCWIAKDNNLLELRMEHHGFIDPLSGIVMLSRYIDDNSHNYDQHICEAVNLLLQTIQKSTEPVEEGV